MIGPCGTGTGSVGRPDIRGVGRATTSQARGQCIDHTIQDFNDWPILFALVDCRSTRLFTYLLGIQIWRMTVVEPTGFLLKHCFKDLENKFSLDLKPRDILT